MGGKGVKLIQLIVNHDSNTPISRREGANGAPSSGVCATRREPPTHSHIPWRKGSTLQPHPPSRSHCTRLQLRYHSHLHNVIGKLGPPLTRACTEVAPRPACVVVEHCRASSNCRAAAAINQAGVDSPTYTTPSPLLLSSPISHLPAPIATTGSRRCSNRPAPNSHELSACSEQSTQLHGNRFGDCNIEFVGCRTQGDTAHGCLGVHLQPSEHGSTIRLWLQSLSCKPRGRHKVG